MFLFKPKLKSEEILPPPAPVLELEEGPKVKSKFFDEFIKPEESQKISPEDEKIKKFIEDLSKQLKPEEPILKKGRISLKKEKPKIPKKLGVKQPKKLILVKQIKEKKPLPLKKIKPTKREAKPKVEFPELEEDFELPKIDLELHKEIEKPFEKEIELPDTLEELDKELEQERPKEILEAEEEIKDAIEKIKKQEKPSFLKKLFTKKEKVEEKPVEETLMPELPETDEISAIQNKINKAREALTKFDLETAKNNYIEIMKIYNKISPEKQAKVYYDINDLYAERKNAEELKV